MPAGGADGDCIRAIGRAMRARSVDRSALKPFDAKCRKSARHRIFRALSFGGCRSFQLDRPRAGLSDPSGPPDRRLYAQVAPPIAPLRLIAAKLESTLGQAIAVENKPGGNGAVAAQYVAQAEPDGYTLFFTTRARSRSARRSTPI